MADESKDDHPYIWRFFRAGGFDQVRVDSGADAAHLGALDQKLWVALACPTRGIQFDERTLDLIDDDHDGRVRAPDILAAVNWTCGVLKDLGELQRGGDSLPLAAIDDTGEAGRAIRASAETILAMLGKKDATAISLQDTADVEKIYDGTPFNGDGIIIPASAGDPATESAITDIIACLGSEVDRSHKPGVSQALIDRFFSEAALYAAWHDEGDGARGALQPLGDGVDTAGALMAELAPKLDDFYARTRLAAFDPQAGAALNPPLAAYEALSPTALASDGAAIAALPLARVAAGAGLSFTEGLNPAWEGRVAQLRDASVTPLLGARDMLLASEWDEIKARFANYAAWRARKPETSLEKLGIERLRVLLDPALKPRIDALVERDKALEPQVSLIGQVEKLVRMKRDLLLLLNNFVAFKDFYRRTGKAVFQAGTLYLDARSCDLCVRVEDENKHALLATLSGIYLAYCRCSRAGGKESMTIVAAFTAGDSDNLRVGRNGVFYDRKGRDWDATIVKIVEHPISLRQAFWLPYKQAARFINEQIQKMAAARAATVQTHMAQQNMMRAAGVAAPTAQQQQQQAFDAARFAGIFAAIGLAIGAIGTAIASMVTGFLQLTWWQMPLALLGIILIVSGPSCIIAALKLRKRNLGPILDASGWAVNTRLKINPVFGRALTATAQLPEGAERATTDPYAEKKRPWGWYITLAVIVLVLLGLWRYGLLAHWLKLG